MASLTFNKEGGNWVAYFKAEADFALHIERDEAGVMSMEQSTTGGGYAVVEDFPARSRYGRTFDYEFSGLVYPKFIRITSTSDPTFAEVVSNGEVTEIKSQSKEIEVTANGTMDITPDAGFSYLNSVKVKTNVAQSGEGGGTSYRFYSIEKLESKIAAVECVAPLFARVNGLIIPAALAFASNMWESVSALSTDASAKLFIDGAWRNIGEMLDGGSSFLQGIGIVEITESEFYNLNA